LLEATIVRGTISPGQEYFGRCCWEGERTGLQQIELLLAGPQGEECSGASEPLEGASLWIRNDEQQEVENIAKQILGANDVIAAYEKIILPAEERVRQAFLTPALQRELNAVAQALLEHETLTGIQVATIVAGAAEAE